MHDNGRGVSKVSLNAPLGHLRTFLTLLVVAHHAVIAYHPYAPPVGASLLVEPRLWTAFPIVDVQRWSGWGLLVGFNDTFFMSLMFLISGVFAWPSLQRKGAGQFVRDRALRLGIPFLVAAGLLAPLAYYPAYLQTGGSGLSGFVHQWLALGEWPAGPAWFVWVLLAFGIVAALLTKLSAGWGEAIGRSMGRLGERPIVWVAALIALSAIAYLPMAAIFDGFSWSTFGPFYFQNSRILHYAVYFVVGMGLGAWGSGRGLLAPDGRLARRWGLWVGAGLLAYMVALGTFLVVMGTMAKGGPGFALTTFGNFTFVLSCALQSLGCLAVFTRFARRPETGRSLGASAYGIYLLHYVCVSWLQYSLLKVDVSAVIKGLAVWAGAVALSWALTVVLRKVPLIARVV
jgi:surface polysaccharide O-acyltransferase-like enzyme